MAKHRRYVPHCHWKNAIAVLMAGITAGAWIPFVSDPHDATTEEDEEDTLSVPALVYEEHDPPSWPVKSVPRVNLQKHPKPKHNPATDPTHGFPTPQVPIKLQPKPKPKPPVVHPPAVHHTTQEQALVEYLRLQIGKPYVFGGNGPSVFDCSGLTRAAYESIGIYLPRTSEAQSTMGVGVSLAQLRVGDLLFYGVAPGLAFHVAVYVGGGLYIAAQNPSTGVVERSIYNYMPNFARRIL